MTPAPTLQDLIASVGDDADSDDPLELLGAALGMASELDNVKDELLGYFVDRCRGAGKSWTEISSALGVTRQAAHRKFTMAEPRLERFTNRARRVLWIAPEAALAMHHDTAGTEHLLLALLIEHEGVAGQVLEERGLTRASVEAAIAMVVPRADTTPTGPAPFTPQASTVLTGAVTSAIELGHNYVGTEHLLLALLRDRDSLAARILDANQIGIDDVRERVIELLAGNTAAHPPTTPIAPTTALPLGALVEQAAGLFTNFTPAARLVILRAQEQARALRHGYIGTEHLLLGLFDYEEGVARGVLEQLGATRPFVLGELAKRIGPGEEEVTGNIPFTPRAKARLEQAVVAAKALHECADTEHLLLALVSGGDAGIAALILAEKGGTEARISELVLAAREARAIPVPDTSWKRAAAKSAAKKANTRRRS
ncbi:MAG: Clp protease N-terminal domain-containing protein [Acidimicrobiia bacterium]